MSSHSWTSFDHHVHARTTMDELQNDNVNTCITTDCRRGHMSHMKMEKHWPQWLYRSKLVDNLEIFTEQELSYNWWARPFVKWMSHSERSGSATHILILVWLPLFATKWHFDVMGKTAMTISRWKPFQSLATIWRRWFSWGHHALALLEKDIKAGLSNSLGDEKCNKENYSLE